MQNKVCIADMSSASGGEPPKPKGFDPGPKHIGYVTYVQSKVRVSVHCTRIPKYKL